MTAEPTEVNLQRDRFSRNSSGEMGEPHLEVIVGGLDQRRPETNAAVGGAVLHAVEIDQTATEAIHNETDVYRKTHDLTTLSVDVESKVTEEDLKAITPPAVWQELQTLTEVAKERDIHYMYVNATSNGGGVAIMRSSTTHTARVKGLKARWDALKINQEAAKVTKWKFHNVLQDVGDPDAELTEEDKFVYEAMIDENFDLIKDQIMELDVLIIDDWQPSRFINYIKGYEEQTPDGPIWHEGIKPDLPIIFRDHIHTEGGKMVTPGTRQHKTWRYLWEDNGIKNADVFVAHPKAEFVPPNVPPEKVVYMGAAIDLLDDLNRYLPVEEKELGWAFVNERLAMNENQQPLDLSRPYIVLIARFDESKGMPQGIEAYAKARRMMIEQGADEKDIPQLMIIGNGSVDDPSGEMMLNEIMDLRALTGALDPAEYGDIKTDLKVIRVPHNDVAINTVLKGAKVALQPSTKEGFESRVTDAIFQGVPVIGSTEGGIPLQIIEGKSGFVRNPYDTTEWGRLIAKLSTDKESYEKLVETTKTTAWEHNYQFTNIPNVISWLKLILIMTDPESRAQFKGNHRWVKDIEVPESALRVPEAA